MRTIGVVTPGVVNQRYLGEVFRGIADTVKQHRYGLLLNIQTATRSDDLDQFFGRGGCEGAIIVVPENYELVLAKCREYGRIFVQVDYLDEAHAEGVPVVEADNAGGIMQVMEHLLALGHRRIGFVAGRMLNASARQRLEAYRAALAAAGIPYDEQLVYAGGWLQGQGYEAGKRLLSIPQPPTAIATCSDGAASGVSVAAREFGLEVGKTFSLTGFDDVRIAAELNPPLTTVRQPMYEMGRTSVEMLLARLDGKPLPELHVTLPTQLVVRGSTAPVRE